MITQMAGEQRNSIAGIWAKDVEETEQKLMLGHEVALRKVKKVLGVDGGEQGSEAVEGGDDESDYQLQKCLKYAERGVKRMVKGLPKDDME